MGGQTIGATDTRVVRVYADGQLRVVPTRADTVEDLLNRLDITLKEKDIIEPALDTEITDDNFQVNIYRARPVLIEDGGKKSVILTAAPSPNAVAKAAGLEVFPEDIIEQKPLTELDPAEVIKNGGIEERIVIDRATPIDLNIFGTQVSLRTHAETIDELLAERNLGDVTVLPARGTKISKDLSVFVTEPGKKLRVVQEEIPFETEYIEDHGLLLGEEKTRQAGVLGKRAIVYETDENGKEIVFNEVIVRQPVKEIVLQGRKLGSIFVSAQSRPLMAAAGIAESDFGYAYDIISRESGWNVTARNSTSGAYGLCQALPGSKMASAGADWQTNPVTQLRWCNSYAQSARGGWYNAYIFWQTNHWW